MKSKPKSVPPSRLDGLKQKLAVARKGTGGKPCSVCILPPDYRSLVDEILAKPARDRNVSFPHLARLLQEEGPNIGDGALIKHANSLAHHQARY